MPTIGEVYNPLIEAALSNNNNGHALLEKAAVGILAANPDKCPNIEDARQAARNNLDYYCQYFDPKDARKVKDFYQLGRGFMTLAGVKLAVE